MPKLRMNCIYKYSRPYNKSFEFIEGMPNYFFYTSTDYYNLALLEKGVNNISSIKATEGERIPAVLIRSSPHKIGSVDTPWQDYFDTDNGHIRYFGDAKANDTDPLTNGNKILLSLFKQHTSLDQHEREKAVPLIFFKSVKYKSKTKGYVKFQGFGIISKIELVTQYDRQNHKSFINYAYDFIVFDMASENEYFNWDWISSRRDSVSTLNQTLSLAPKSWKLWIKKGNNTFQTYRRRVSKLLVTSRKEQICEHNSKEEKVLKEIYDFFSKKSLFEGLALHITSRYFKKCGFDFKSGWITSPTSDGGTDFVGHILLGSGFGKSKLIVLGQAKCEKLNSPTGGNHIARTVARLRRGWIGVYVTTSFFSESSQQEIIEDNYPIVLINGKKLAELILEELFERELTGVNELLEEIKSNYESQIQIRKPEELFYEA